MCSVHMQLNVELNPKGPYFAPSTTELHPTELLDQSLWNLKFLFKNDTTPNILEQKSLSLWISNSRIWTEFGQDALLVSQVWSLNVSARSLYGPKSSENLKTVDHITYS